MPFKIMVSSIGVKFSMDASIKLFLGIGVLCQAKSGIGKTVVFTLEVLQQIGPLTAK